MRAEPGDYVIGTLMILFAGLGLVVASRALDAEMYVFGLSLSGFAVAFVFGQIRRHYDAVDAERARAGSGTRVGIAARAAGHD